ncbi:MAG: hypothetical protein GJU73_06720 [Ferrovum sp.]|nr:hypothetical protein [Ferrovum sp.]
MRRGFKSPNYTTHRGGDSQ